MPQTNQHRAGTKIGLIGGLAHRAGIFYYEQLLHRHQALNQPLALTLIHADVNTVLTCVSNQDKSALGSYLGNLSNELFTGGADFVAITAVAPHLAIREISGIAHGPIVNVLETIASGLKAAHLQRVAVFGNRSVMTSNIFGTLPEEAIVKLDSSQLDEIHQTYTDIALHGKRGTAHESELLNRIARDLIQNSGAQAIVLAGTDLSSFYAAQSPAYPSLDVAQLHIDEIMRRIENHS